MVAVGPVTNLGGLALALALLLLMSGRRPPAVRTLAWAALGGCVAAAVQAKAFGYHWLPAAGCLLAAAGLGLALAGDRMPRSRAISGRAATRIAGSARAGAAARRHPPDLVLVDLARGTAPDGPPLRLFPGGADARGFEAGAKGTDCFRAHRPRPGATGFGFRGYAPGFGFVETTGPRARARPRGSVKCDCRARPARPRRPGRRSRRCSSSGSRGSSRPSAAGRWRRSSR